MGDTALSAVNELCMKTDDLRCSHTTEDRAVPTNLMDYTVYEFSTRMMCYSSTQFVSLLRRAIRGTVIRERQVYAPAS
jgi:hypothetical protein